MGDQHDEGRGNKKKGGRKGRNDAQVLDSFSDHVFFAWARFVEQCMACSRAVFALFNVTAFVIALLSVEGGLHSDHSL